MGYLKTAAMFNYFLTFIFETFSMIQTAQTLPIMPIKTRRILIHAYISKLFLNNHLKSNPEKCHFITTSKVQIAIGIPNCLIKNEE